MLSKVRNGGFLAEDLQPYANKIPNVLRRTIYYLSVADNFSNLAGYQAA